MSDQNQTPEVEGAAPLRRIFQIGTTRIVEDEATAQLNVEQIRGVLQAAYPEVAHATIRERIDPERGLRLVEFMPQPGRKG